VAAVAAPGGGLGRLGARHAADPVIPLRLFRDQTFRIACTLSLITGIGMFGAISYLPTYLQVVTGVSATSSGLLLLPLIGGLLVTSISSGRLIARTGHYKAYPVAGTAIAAAGLHLLSTMGVNTSHLTSSLYLLVLGLGIGLFLQVMVLIVQNTAAHHDLGAATSSVNFARQIGSSIGVALIGALFIHQLDGQLAAHLPASAAGHLSAHQVGSITPQGLAHLPAPLKHIIAAAFAQALHPLYAYLIPLMAVAFLLALLLKEIPLPARARQDAARADPHGREHVGRAPQPPAPAHPGEPARSHHRPRPRRVHAAARNGRQASQLPPRTRRNSPPPSEPPSSTTRISR
jgi:hypothetical protein